MLKRWLPRQRLERRGESEEESEDESGDDLRNHCSKWNLLFKKRETEPERDRDRDRAGLEWTMTQKRECNNERIISPGTGGLFIAIYLLRMPDMIPGWHLYTTLIFKNCPGS